MVDVAEQSKIDRQPKIIGRYELHDEIAQGGTSTVHLGRMRGPVGFARLVAVKRLHPHLASDPEVVARLTDEARIAGRISHTNVVQVIDVIVEHEEVLIVMEYVHGSSLAALLTVLRARSERIPPAIAVAILCGALHGLHAAHEAKDLQGESLNVVHRDVSPSNVLVGFDGVVRIGDFGIAKAVGRLQTTAHGEVRGKLSYMSPEQLRGEPLDRRADVYSASVVLWELLTSRRLFDGSSEDATVSSILAGGRPPSAEVSPTLDAVIVQGLARRPGNRYATARAMALALERALPPAPALLVSEWMSTIAADEHVRLEDCVTRVRTATGLVLVPRENAPAPAGRAGVSPRASWAVGAALILVAAAAFVAGRGTPRASSAEASPAALAAPAGSPPHAPTQAMLPSPAPTALVLASATTDPGAHDASPPVPNPTPRPPALRPSAPAATPCVPYIVDSLGHRKYNADCL